MNILRGNSTNLCNGVGKHIQLLSSRYFSVVVHTNIAQLYNLVSGGIVLTIFGIAATILFAMDEYNRIEEEGGFVCCKALIKNQKGRLRSWHSIPTEDQIPV